MKDQRCLRELIAHYDAKCKSGNGVPVREFLMAADDWSLFRLACVAAMDSARWEPTEQGRAYLEGRR